MKSEVKVFERGNGEVQRVQVVSWDDWSKLDFLWLEQNNFEQQKKALECFHDIYQNYLVPTMPWIFPKMVMFVLPSDEKMDALLKKCAKAEHDLCYESKRYGKVSDPLTVASIILREGVKRRRGKLIFANSQAEALYQELEARGCIKSTGGKFPGLKVIPVGRFAGYLSEVEPDAKIKVNSTFFIMDPFDCATIYDQIGMSFGLCVKNGVVEVPPLYEREALLVEKDGTAYISEKDIKELIIEINGKTYVPGKNTTLYTRPARKRTPEEKRKLLVIVGRRVVAIKHGGKVDIPAAGFVMTVGKDVAVEPGDEVTYHGLKDVQFGIQAGNSIVRKGVKTERFISRFYDIFKLQPVPFPPSLYPMDFEKARAARIALGADKNGKPVLFWAEGKGKITYKPGEDSTGASLVEMAEIVEDLELYNAINLDGGGSAQILLENVRTLHISDRNKEDNSDAERLIPLGLVVK